MSNKRKLILLYALPLIIMVVPYLAFAQSIHSNVWDPTILAGPLVTCVGSTTSTLPVQNTCQNLCDLLATVANVIYFMIGVVIWVIAPIMLAWAGLLFLLSRGSPERTGSARKMLTGTVIGLLIVLCAYLIVATFVTVVGGGNSNSLGIGGFGTTTCTQTQ